MFKNCVFKPDVNTIKWCKATGVRAIKTMAQTFIATIGSAAVLASADWKVVVSATGYEGV